MQSPYSDSQEPLWSGPCVPLPCPSHQHALVCCSPGMPVFFPPTCQAYFHIRTSESIVSCVWNPFPSISARLTPSHHTGLSLAVMAGSGSPCPHHQESLPALQALLITLVFCALWIFFFNLEYYLKVIKNKEYY